MTYVLVNYQTAAVALARTGTRSDCAVLDFFVTFFVKKKSK
jgi:hypothetical protein